MNYFIKNHKKCFKNLRKFHDFDIDPIEYLVFDDRKLVFIVLSKVACTSIKASIGESYGIEAREKSGMDIHRHSEWNRYYGKLRGKRTDYFSFAFVRNPLSRLVSCYYDRVICEHENYYFKDYGFEIPPNISFEEFICRIVKIPDYLADRHFKSQSYSIYRTKRRVQTMFQKNKTFQPDYVGKFENLNNDWAYLAKKFNFNSDLKPLNPSTQSTKKIDYRTHYDKKLLNVVYKRFKDDFLMLGYNDDYKILKKQL